MVGRTACGLLLVVSLVGAVACRPGGYSTESDATVRRGKPAVYVVNYPLAFFASRIGGEAINVEFPVPADLDPAFWKPDDAAVTQYQQADLILLNGAGYAKWIEKVSLPTSRLVDTSRLFADKLISYDGGVIHSHGPGGAHSHSDIAFTTWLDPKLALLQAEQVHMALVKLLPTNAESLDANYRQLEAELEQLDQTLEAVAARYQGEPLLASHPVYQYLARRCGWNLKSLHWEPNEVPEEKEWDVLSELLKSHSSKWMLWEAPPDRETAERLAAIGVTSIVFDPCANQSAADFLEVMADNIQRLTTIFPN